MDSHCCRSLLFGRHHRAVWHRCHDLSLFSGQSVGAFVFSRVFYISSKLGLTQTNFGNVPYLETQNIGFISSLPKSSFNPVGFPRLNPPLRSLPLSDRPWGPGGANLPFKQNLEAAAQSSFDCPHCPLCFGGLRWCPWHRRQHPMGVQVFGISISWCDQICHLVDRVLCGSVQLSC